MSTTPENAHARSIAKGDTAELLLKVHLGFGGLEKLVLIKRLLPHICDDSEFTAAFVAAARRAAALNHHHVAEIYDINSDESETYVTSEYVPGEDLGFIMRMAAVKQQPMPVPIACRIIAQAALGVHCGHRATGPEGEPLGLVHGSLTPNNVVVHSAGIAKVTDFGLSWSADPRGRHANDGCRLVKLAYSAPEQVLDSHVDFRADVYALGVLLYELLVGRPLFWDATTSVRERVLQMRVPPPSRLNASVCPELDEIVLQAIERDIEKRCPSAQRLHEQLNEYLIRQRTFASEHEVNAWLSGTFKDRNEQRQLMERAVFAQSRQQSIGTNLSSAPNSFSGTPETNPFSSLAPITTPSSLGEISAVHHSELTASTGRATSKRSNLLVLVLLGGLVALLIVAGAFAVLLYDEHLAPPEVPVAESGQNSPVSLVVHVSPEESAVDVNGKRISDAAGDDGVLVPVLPEKLAKVVVSKEGFITNTRSVEAPDNGSMHVYVTLGRVVNDAGVVDGLAPANVAERISDAGAGSAARAQDNRVVSDSTRRSLAAARRRAIIAAHRRRTRSARYYGRTASPKSQQATHKSTLLISYRPKGARVSLDGVRRYGPSPLRIESVTPGVHIVKVEAPGYGSQTTHVDISEEQHVVAASIELSVQAKRTPIKIVSRPSGATLTIDGKPHGNTPTIGLRLRVGVRYRIKLTRPGYQPWETVLDLRTAAPNRIEANMQVARKQPKENSTLDESRFPTLDADYGSLLIEAPNEPNGEVWINGIKRGRPPLVVGKIPSGVILVEIRNGNRVVRTKQVNLAPNERRRLTIR